MHGRHGSVLKKRKRVVKRIGILHAVSVGLIFLVCSAHAWQIKRVDSILGQNTSDLEGRIGSLSDAVTPIPLFNSDVSGGVITMNTSGSYQVVEDLTNCSFVITASRVFLDFKQHKVTNTTSSANIIAIHGTTQVRIANGYIQGAGVAGSSGSGIKILAGASQVTIKDMTISGCGTGVSFAGTNTTNNVTQCSVNRVRLLLNDIGLSLTYADATLVKKCTAAYSNQIGFSVVNSSANCFYDCNALKTGSDTGGLATTIGFKSTGGTGNMFQRCVTKQTKTSSTTFGDKACGFLLTGSETKTKIVDCIVNETDVVNSVTALTYGIHIEPTSNGGLSNLVTMTISASPVICVAWSPDSQYLLEVDGSRTQIFKWDGVSQLQTVTSVSPAALSWSKWSPDGKYIAMVDSASNGNLRVYSFNGNALTVAATPVVVSTGKTPTNVEWSPNGKYLAVFYLYSIALFSFDGATLTAGAVSADLGSGTWFGCSWSPDGQYLVGVGGAKKIYVVNLAMQTVAQATVSAAANNDVGVLWSPTGKYIAVSTQEGNITVFSFNGTSLTQACPAISIGVADYLFALAWSPDGRYLAAASGATPSGSNVLKLYNFTGTALTQVGASWAILDRAYSLSWSPDGKTIALGEGVSGGFGRIRLYSALYGPTNCFVDNCKVCDTQAANFNMGRGFVAGGNNIFINNVACNNGVSYSYGIPNVYDGRFELPALRNVVQPFDNVSMPTTL